jgi:nickel transport protein
VRRFLLAIALSMSMVSTVSAHKLKVFATVEAGTITGYGFFLGGGRARGSSLIIRDASGQEVLKGETDDEGRFSWRPPSPSDFVISIDTREGHMAEVRIPASRFSTSAVGAPVDASATIASAAPDKPAAAAGACEPRTTDLNALVEAAVSRQVRPVLERMEAMDGNLQLRDIVSGVCMIFGLAGIALWIVGRKTGESGKRNA